MIIASLIAVHTKYILSAVISIGVVGMGLCITFLYLQAPDLAMPQIVVEVIALVILSKATQAEKDLLMRKNRKEILAAVVILVFIVFFGYFSYRYLGELEFGNTPMRAAQFILNNGLEKTGAGNLVTSVIFDFRGFDTLGEATILFTAVLGTVVVLRKEGKKDKKNE